MTAISRATWHSVCWRLALLAAAIAVGGALAMTVILAAVAMAASALAGVSSEQVPTLLTSDPVFPWFCAAAGVFTAFAAGYITARLAGGPTLQHVLAACLVTVFGHLLAIALLGSPLAWWGTVLYIGLASPALVLGWYCGIPAPCRPSCSGSDLDSQP
jgi:hypothetical protein